MTPDLDRILEDLRLQRDRVNRSVDDTLSQLRTDDILKKLEDLRRRSERTAPGASKPE